MEPEALASTTPSEGVDSAFGVTTEGAGRLTPIECYLLDALERLDAAETRAGQLEAALAHSRDIGAAIGILMGLSRLTREQAFEQLRRTSMSRNVKLYVLATQVVETGSLEPL